jgi:hypothetical protein
VCGEQLPIQGSTVMIDDRWPAAETDFLERDRHQTMATSLLDHRVNHSDEFVHSQRWPCAAGPVPVYYCTMVTSTNNDVRDLMNVELFGVGESVGVGEHGRFRTASEQGRHRGT